MLSRSHSGRSPRTSQGGLVGTRFSVTSVGNVPRVNFNHFSVTLREPHYLLHFSHIWPTRVVHKPARVSPEGVTNFTQISSSAPMGSQICPSGSKKCAKWAQGYENDTQSDPKRVQMVLKGDQSGPRVVPTVASRVPKSTKEQKTRSRKLAGIPSCFSISFEMQSAGRVHKMAGVPSYFSIRTYVSNLTHASICIFELNTRIHTHLLDR